MFKKLIVVAAGAAAISVIPAVPAWADAPDGVGNNTTETRDTGAPDNPNGWGSTTSHFADARGGIGEHASSFPTPRQGVGNVGPTDGGEGTRPSDHAEVVAGMIPNPAFDPALPPGKPR